MGRSSDRDRHSSSRSKDRDRDRDRKREKRKHKDRDEKDYKRIKTKPSLDEEEEKKKQRKERLLAWQMKMKLASEATESKQKESQTKSTDSTKSDKAIFAFKAVKQAASASAFEADEDDDDAPKQLPRVQDEDRKAVEAFQASHPEENQEEEEEEELEPEFKPRRPILLPNNEIGFGVAQEKSEKMDTSKDSEDNDVQSETKPSNPPEAVEANAEQRAKEQDTQPTETNSKDDKMKVDATATEQDNITEAKVENGHEEDEEDPLDAFMKDVNQEVTELKEQDEKREKMMQRGATVGKSNRGERLSQMDDGFDVADPSKEKPKSAAEIIQQQYWSGFAPKQRRELGVPDHATINYLAFRKDFYHEVPDLMKMTDEEVAAYRFEMENIRVRGKACPRPIKTWNQCGLSSKIMETLRKQKYEKPTPIQAQALPVIMSGRDMLGIAKTGSGKTLAFLLPMFRHILDQPPLQPHEGPIAIILSPTRELATQTYLEAKKFAKPFNMRVACVYGGTNISDQIAALKRGAEVIVCTPGRMIDMLTANSGRVTNCRRVTYIVLDEADRMFDMGFEPQVMRILDNIRPDRQTVMFSATFPRPMEVLARKILKKPIEIQVGGRSVVSDTVTQKIVILEEDEKYYKLLELLGHYYIDGAILVFVHKQDKADHLLSDLFSSGYPCLALHGGIPQEDRDSNLHDFKIGNVKILVATSVAARGLDVKTLKLVVNYDCPNHYEDYVHRCGRTGRAGRKGTAFTFITRDEGCYAGEIIKALELSGNQPPEELMNLFEEYRIEREKAGKPLKGTGFGGKGYKFNAAEAMRTQQMRMLALKAHAEEDGDDDDDEYRERERELVAEIESQVGILMGEKKKTTDVFNSSTGETEPTDVTMEGNIGDITQTKNALKMTGTGSFSKKAEAMARAMKINQKYGFKSAGQAPKPGEGIGFGHFDDEIEINDFPHSARFKVTRKEYIEEITKFSGAAITVRGQYYPPKKKPPEGERKLYLFIEGTTEESVLKAKAEIRRILSDDLHTTATTFQSSHQRAMNQRYTMLALTD